MEMEGGFTRRGFTWHPLSSDHAQSVQLSSVGLDDGAEGREEDLYGLSDRLARLSISGRPLGAISADLSREEEIGEGGCPVYSRIDNRLILGRNPGLCKCPPGKEEMALELWYYWSCPHPFDQPPAVKLRGLLGVGWASGGRTPGAFSISG